MRTLEFVTQRGRRHREQIGGNFQARGSDYVHRPRGEAIQYLRENRVTRGRRHTLINIGGHHLRAAARKFLFEQWPAVAAFDDEYAAARRMFETRVLEQAVSRRLPMGLISTAGKRRVLAP